MIIPEIALFEFNLEALDEIILPEYKGSTFRGGFGNFFKRIVCALKRETCSNCLMKEKCIYVYVFETMPPSGSNKLRNFKNIPQPFILEPPLETKRFYKEKDVLKFRLVLVGKAIEYLPYFIYTFEEVGKAGIGKGRGRYSIREVTLPEKKKPHCIYTSSEKTLHAYNTDIKKIIKKKTNDIMKSCALKIKFETPTRIVSEEKLVSKPEFHYIISNLIRRVSNLLQFHCNIDVSWDFKKLIEDSHSVKSKVSDIYWYDWERYSRRQDTRMKLGGFVGEIEFEGDFTSFAFPLALGEYLHIGKNTTFGLGKYSICLLN